MFADRALECTVRDLLHARPVFKDAGGNDERVIDVREPDHFRLRVEAVRQPLPQFREQNGSVSSAEERA